MLELAILGVLKEQDLHGYELKRRLTEMLGTFSAVSFGSLYPALGRLERADAVKAVEANDAPAAAPPSPATGSLGAELAAFRARARAARGEVRSPGRGGRSRKVYGITVKGDRLFEDLLADAAASTEDDRAFNLRLAFARHLPDDARLGLLERRRAALVERLDRGRRSLKAAGTDTYGRSLLEHGTEVTEHDISWLDRLIAAERERTRTSREDTPT